jgi:CheY-like chemotaxis protein
MTLLNILVVEDDPDLAESIGEVPGLGRHNVRVAPNGAEAIKRLEEMKSDLNSVDVRTCR